MAESQLGIRFTTKQFNSTIRELRSVAAALEKLDQSQKKSTEATRIQTASNKDWLNTSANIITALNTTVMVLGKVVRMGVNLGTTVVSHVGKFGFAMVRASSDAAELNFALEGALKSGARAREFRELATAMQLDPSSIAGYKTVMETLAGFSRMPALREQFISQDGNDLPKKILNIVMGLAAIDPVQGVFGARLTLREAISGYWRTLRMRFELRPEDVFSTANIPFTTENKRDPEKAIEALNTFVNTVVGPDTLANIAKTFNFQVEKMKGNYDLFLRKIADTGPYQEASGGLVDLNTKFAEFITSAEGDIIAERIGSVYEDAFRRARVVLEKIDWTKPAAEIAGDLFEALAAEAKSWDTKYGDIVSDSIGKAFEFAEDRVGTLVANVGARIGDKFVQGIDDAITSDTSDSPIKSLLRLAVGGFAVGGAPGAVAAPVLGGTVMVGAEAGRRRSLGGQLGALAVGGSVVAGAPGAVVATGLGALVLFAKELAILSGPEVKESFRAIKPSVLAFAQLVNSLGLAFEAMGPRTARFVDLLEKQNIAAAFADRKAKAALAVLGLGIDPATVEASAQAALKRIGGRSAAAIARRRGETDLRTVANLELEVALIKLTRAQAGPSLATTAFGTGAFGLASRFAGLAQEGIEFRRNRFGLMERGLDPGALRNIGLFGGAFRDIPSFRATELREPSLFESLQRDPEGLSGLTRFQETFLNRRLRLEDPKGGLPTRQLLLEQLLGVQEAQFREAATPRARARELGEFGADFARLLEVRSAVLEEDRRLRVETEQNTRETTLAVLKLNDPDSTLAEAIRQLGVDLREEFGTGPSRRSRDTGRN